MTDEPWPVIRTFYNPANNEQQTRCDCGLIIKLQMYALRDMTASQNLEVGEQLDQMIADHLKWHAEPDKQLASQEQP